MERPRKQGKPRIANFLSPATRRLAALRHKWKTRMAFERIVSWFEKRRKFAEENRTGARVARMLGLKGVGVLVESGRSREELIGFISLLAARKPEMIKAKALIVDREGRMRIDLNKLGDLLLGDQKEITRNMVAVDRMDIDPSSKSESLALEAIGSALLGGKKSKNEIRDAAERHLRFFQEVDRAHSVAVLEARKDVRKLIEHGCKLSEVN